MVNYTIGNTSATVLAQDETLIDQVVQRLLTNGTKSFTSDTPTDYGHTHMGHQLSRAYACVVSACFVLIIILAITCNTILIATIISVKKLHTFVNFYIANLAIGDIITAVGTIPFDVEYILRGYFAHGIVACGIMHTTFLISLPSSVLCLTLITAERFITIVFSLRKIITKRRVIASVIIMWCYTLLTAMFPLMYHKKAVTIRRGVCYLRFPLCYQIFQVTANFLIPMVFIVCVYAKLFMISYSHANKSARTSTKLGMKLLDSFRRKESLIDAEKAARKRKISRSAMFHRNIKASKRIGLLVGVFLLCWLPYIVMVAMNYVCRCHPRELTWVANIINYSSTAINPLLYGLLNKQIRKEVVKKCRGIRGRLPSASSGTSSRRRKSGRADLENSF